MIGALAIAAAVGAEGLAFYALAEIVAAGYDPPRHAANATTFVTVSLVAYWHVRLADWYGLRRPWTVVVAIVVPFVTLYGALRLEFAGDFALWDFGWALDFLAESEGAARRGGQALVGALLLVPLWVRSSFRAGDEMDLESLSRSLAVPFTIVTVLVVLGAPTDRTAEVGRAAAAFYLAGLVALCLSQLSLSGATLGMVRSGGVTAALLGLVAAGVAVSLVVLTVVFAVLSPVLGPPLEAVITTILIWVLTPPAWALEHLFSWLFAGAQLFPDRTQDLSRALGSGQPGEDQAPRSTNEAARFLLRILGLAVLVGGAAVAVFFAARFRRRSADLLTTADGQPAGSLGDDLLGWFRSLLPGRRRARDRGLRGGGVYALYGNVLDAAEDRGRGRMADTTPREFAPALSDTFHATVTDEITVAFEEARYGGREPDREALVELERRWLAARATGLEGQP